jgi:carbamate kinase
VCGELQHQRAGVEGDATRRVAKFVGPVYDEPSARQQQADRVWDMRQDGPAWRRVVPSPEPVQIVEPDAL